MKKVRNLDLFAVVTVAILLSGCETPQDIKTSSSAVEPSYFGYCYFGGDIDHRQYWMEQYKNCHQYRPEQASTCCQVNFGQWIEKEEPKTGETIEEEYDDRDE